MDRPNFYQRFSIKGWCPGPSLTIKSQCLCLPTQQIYSQIYCFRYLGNTSEMILKLIFTVCLIVVTSSWTVSMFYCGFGGDFCGQSKIDDVNQYSDFVILAFANTKADGSVEVDQAMFPSNLVSSWRQRGKKVILSVGGQNGNWGYVFRSQANTFNFIRTFAGYVKKYNLDGVDLDIESYMTPPRVVSNMIINLKKALGNKLLIVSPEDVVVYQGSPVPSPDAVGQVFNYFVPIINMADSFIDFYQPQAYNNWYDGLAGGSFEYLKDVYLNWRNLQGLSPWTQPLPNFAGVNGNKLLIGLLASSSAGGAAYYAQPNAIKALKSFLTQNKYPLKGFMIWDSHWDSLNNYQISNVCKQ